MTSPKKLIERSALSAAIILLLGACSAPRARAEHEEIDRPRVDIDVESLKAELRWSRGEWALRVKYDIEIKDFNRDDGFELVLYLSEQGEALRDGEDEPIEWFVPLDKPSEIDDDEIEFEDHLTVYLPEDAIRYPAKLRINGVVYQKGYEIPLVRKIKSVSYKRSKRYAYRVDPAPLGYAPGYVGAYRPYYIGFTGYYGYSGCYRPVYRYCRPGYTYYRPAFRYPRFYRSRCW